MPKSISGSASVQNKNFTKTASVPVDGDQSSGARLERIVKDMLNNWETVDQAGITTARLDDESVTEAKMDIHNAPANNQILTYSTTNGLEWKSMDDLIQSAIRSATWTPTFSNEPTGYTGRRVSTGAYRLGALGVYAGRFDTINRTGSWQEMNVDFSVPFGSPLLADQVGIFQGNSPAGTTGTVTTTATRLRITIRKPANDTQNADIDILGLYLISG